MGIRILHNDFLMGDIKELKQDENQVGISLSGYQQIGAVQQNQFLHTAGNADFTLGIIAHNIGEMTNVINDNLFSGLDIGNEAVGINGTGNGEDLRGLYYVCNENEDVIDKDFYVRDRTGFEDYINFWQAQYGQTYFRSAGNTFSVSGDPDDGHFANYGDLEIRYYYNGLESDQIPDVDKLVGVIPFDANPSFCIVEPCLRPCPDDIDIEDFSDSYFQLYSTYEDEMALEEYEDAALLRVGIDSILNGLLRWFEWDTTDFDVDTLRTWYSRVDALAGRLHLAKDFLYTNQYSLAYIAIDSIIEHFSLNLEQLLDMDRVLVIIDILSNRSVDNLTNQDIDSLLEYSQGIGASYSMSRSILAAIDSVNTPRYYIPSEIDPRSFQSGDDKNSLRDDILIYPIPAMDEINILFSSPMKDLVEYEIWDINGRVCIKDNSIISSTSTISIPTFELSNGSYVLRIEFPGISLDFEKFIIIR